MNTCSSYFISQCRHIATKLSVRGPVLALAVALSSAVSMPGEVLVRYDFAGMTNPAATLPANPIAAVETAESVTATGFNTSSGFATNAVFRPASGALQADGDVGGGITRTSHPEIFDGRFAFAFWNQNNGGNTLQNVLDRNLEYVSFTFTLGEATTLESLTFDFWCNHAQQSPDVAVFTSVTSNFSGSVQASEAVQTFSPPAGSVALVNNAPDFIDVQTMVVDLSSETYANLTGDVEVRIYFYNSLYNAFARYNWIGYLEVRSPGGNEPDPDPDPVAPAGVAMLPKSRILAPGDTFQLGARVRPSNNTDPTVSWSSDNTSVATVSSGGLLTAEAEGTATITVTTNTGNFTDTCLVTVATPPQAMGIGVIGPDGWTVLAPSPDSRVIYVSSSEGNDSNNGLTPETAMQTIAAANEKIRDNMPDWLLLKRGDTFPHISLGAWRNGRSAEEPVVLSYYGESGSRPVIKLTSELINWNGNGRNHTAFVGLELHRAISDPDAPEFDGSGSGNALRFVPSNGPATNVLVEDCVLRYCAILAQDYENGYPVNVHIRRNAVLGNWRGNTSASNIGQQGMYADGVINFYFVENQFHHNGWNQEIPGAGANQFNHNLYMQTDNGGEIVVMGNFISYAAANGVQLRSGGTAIMNAFVANAIGMNLGYVSYPSIYTGLTRADDNVFTDGRQQLQIAPWDGGAWREKWGGTWDGTWGGQTGAVWGLWKQLVNNVTVNNNIVANLHKDTTGGARTPYKDMASANEFGTGNIAWNWFSGNTSSENPLWPDHTRNCDSYAVSLGYEDWYDYMDAVSQREVGEFPYHLSAYGYIDYIREGFNRTGVTPHYNVNIEDIVIPPPPFSDIIGAEVVSEEIGLYTSDWFGSFFPLPVQWIYHTGFGWCYTAGTESDDAVILWSADTGTWVYANAVIFPWYWDYEAAEWAVFPVAE